MTPDASLVADLHAYDPKLRIRWAKQVSKWFVERKLDRRPVGMETVLPPAPDAPALRHDLWEGWRDGYLHVLTVPVEMAHWRFIAPELARLDSWRQGGFKAINDQMDEQAADWDRATDKRIDNWSEAATRDAYDHMTWFEKRRVSVPEIAMDGFTVRDRRGERALSSAE
jgi:hypothetical protein